MKKLIAIFLAIVVMIGVLPVYAAQTTTLPSAEDSQDLAFAKALGFIDEYADGSETLTRMELAHTFFNIITGGKMEAGYSDSVRFTDVFGEDAAVANFVADLGIMTGSGDDKFDPESEVTYIQLLKTVVSFLGYDTYAMAEGGYPQGYLKQANNLEIIGGESAALDAKITKNRIATVFKLAVNADIAEKNYKGEVAETGINYLEKYRDILTARGIIEANYHVSLNPRFKPDYDEIVFGSELYSLTEFSDNLRDMVGMEIDLYYREGDDGRYEAVYGELRRNTYIDIDGKDIDSLNGNRLKYYKDERRTAVLNISSKAYVVYNGTLCENYDDSIVNVFKTQKKDGSIRLIDNNRDDSYDVVIIDAYDSYVVSYISEDKIFNRFRKNVVLDVSGYESGDIEIVNILNEPLRLEDIKENDILSVSSDIYGQVRRIVVTIDSYTGVLNGYDYNDDETSLTIDDITYRTSAAFIEDFDKSRLTIGNQVKVFFNKDAMIAGIDTDSDDRYNTGYLTGVYQDEGEESYFFKIFTAGGHFVNLTVKNKVRVENLNASVTAEKLLQKGNSYGLIRYNENGLVERAPLLYKTDSDTGEISWLCLYDSSQKRMLDYDLRGSANDNSLFMFEGFDGVSSRGGYPYRRSVMSFGGKVLLSATSIIFYVPEEENRGNSDDYYIESHTMFIDGNTDILFEAYGKDPLSPNIDIAVIKGDRYGTADTVSFENYLIAVKRMSEYYDEERGEILYMIQGLSNGREVQIPADAESLKVCPEHGVPGKGDVIMANIDGTGKARTIEFIFCNESELLNFTTNPSSPTYNIQKRFSYGTVIYKDDTFVTVRFDQPDGTFTTESYPWSNFGYIECNKHNELSVCDATRLFDEYNYPGSASKVVIHTRIGDARTMVIYNE